MRSLRSFGRQRGGSKHRSSALWLVAGWCVLSGGFVGCQSIPGEGPAQGNEKRSQRPPNVIVFFADDLGWGDVEGFDGARLRTPNLKRLGDEGVRLTSFYVGSPACSPSRAALLTGCYPQRVGIPEVLNPGSATALHPEEVTLAEALAGLGYRTGAIGKWHLGDQAGGLPTDHGFESWTGLSYSNDMWPFHYGDHDRGLVGNPNWPDLPLVDRGEVVELNPRQASLTPLYTQRAVEFVQRNHAQPFFLYLAYSHPHIPIAASEAFRGRSGQGLYADMILEIDDSIGQVVGAVEALGLADDTIVWFTSDNGPWTRFGDHAGTTGPWRGDKGTCFEGGMRMPAIVWGPGWVPGGRECAHLTTAMDVLPTSVAFARSCAATEVERPAGRVIDGLDQSEWLRGTGEIAFREAFYYYYPRALPRCAQRPLETALAPLLSNGRGSGRGWLAWAAGSGRPPIELVSLGVRPRRNHERGCGLSRRGGRPLAVRGGGAPSLRRFAHPAPGKRSPSGETRARQVTKAR